LNIRAEECRDIGFGCSEQEVGEKIGWIE